MESTIDFNASDGLLLVWQEHSAFEHQRKDVLPSVSMVLEVGHRLQDWHSLL